MSIGAGVVLVLLVYFTLHGRLMVEKFRLQLDDQPTSVAEFRQTYAAPPILAMPIGIESLFHDPPVDEMNKVILPGYSEYAEPNSAERWSEEEIEAGRQFLDTNAKYFESMDATLSEASSQSRTATSEENFDSHTSELFRAVNAMRVRAVYCAETGDRDGAYNSIARAIRLDTRIMSMVPMYSNVPGVPNKQSLVRAIEKVVTSVELTDEQLRHLSEEMERNLAAAPFDQLLKRERAEVFDRTAAYYDKRWGKTKYHQYIYVDKPANISLCESTLQVLQLPSSNRVKVILEMAQREQSWWDNKLSRYTRSLHQGYDSTHYQCLQVLMDSVILDAVVQCCRTVFAIERYRIAHEGELPQSLEALVPQFLPAVPIDPFVGKPIVFERKHQRDYKVYCDSPAYDTSDRWFGNGYTGSENHVTIAHDAWKEHTRPAMAARRPPPASC